MYIDAHSHWCDPRITAEQIPALITQCVEQNISIFMQAGVDPADWHRQIDLKRKYPDRFLLSFGLHPYFVAGHTQDECEDAMDELSIILDQAIGLGETGLDFRPHIAKDSEDRQIIFFENQLSLAKAAYKPLILHIVQAHPEALKILDVWGAPESGGMVHAFNANAEIANEYLTRGLYLSIGGAVTHERNKHLREAVKNIPIDRLLIESDAPDQAPRDWQGLNNSTSIWRVAQEIATLRETSPLKILEMSTSNFKRLFSL